jgi:sensor domain DACNV-containing protein
MHKAFNLNPEIARRLSEEYSALLKEDSDSTPEDSKEFIDELPSIEQISQLIEGSFWASLKTEEGKTHKFNLVYTSPRTSFSSYKFSHAIKFDEERIVKLAPAIDGQMQAIGIWKDKNDKLEIWGFCDSTSLGMSIETYGAGQLIVSYNYKGKFLITGTRVEKIDSLKYEISSISIPKELPSQVLSETLSLLISQHKKDSSLKKIASHMLSHNHGGSLLIVPNNDQWKASIGDDLMYGTDSYDVLKEATERWDEVWEKFPNKGFLFAGSTEFYRANEELWRVQKRIGQLTAIDGATLITTDLTVLAFGAKIKPINSNDTPNKVLLIEPFEGSKPIESSLASLGGTRHKSAAQFVFDQKSSIALIASQDGRLSAFTWDAENQMVKVIKHAEYAESF